MQEKFGVVLEAVTSKFKAKMDEAKTIAQDTANRIKQTFSQIKPKIDTSNLSELKNATKGLSVLKTTPQIIDASETGTIKTFTKSIIDADGNIKILRNNLTLLKPKMLQVASSSEKTAQNVKKLSSAQKEVKKSSNSLKGIGVNVKNIGNSFHKAMGKVRKFALALLSVRTVFSAVSRASQAYLSFDTELADKLQGAWGALGAQLAPIIEFLINLFAKAVGYVNAFIKALTGINMVARANAKALNKQAGAAKSASKSLTSLDEITNIDDNAGGAGGGDIPQIKLPEVDTGGLEKALKRIKDLASTLFEPIKRSWEIYGTPLKESVINAGKQWMNVFEEVGKSLANVWLNGTGEETVGWFLQIFTRIFDIIGNIGKALKNAWAEGAIGTQIIQFMADTFNSILKFVESIGKSLAKWTASESFQNAIQNILKMLKMTWKWISDIVSWIVDMYKKYLAPVVDEILGLLSDVINLIGAIWNIFKPVVDKIISNLKTYLEPVIQMVGGAIQTIIGIIRLLIQLITGALKGNWDSVWNSMKATAKSVVNGLITFLNGFIKGLNLLLTPLRKVIAAIAQAFGKNISIDNIKLPSIPKLDTGTGYVPEDQMAYIHKGEAVIPKKFNSAEYFSNINDNTETNNLLLDVNRTLIDILEKDNSFYVNGKELARTTYNDFQEEGSRINKNNIVKVG